MFIYIKTCFFFKEMICIYFFSSIIMIEVQQYLCEIFFIFGNNTGLYIALKNINYVSTNIKVLKVNTNIENISIQCSIENLIVSFSVFTFLFWITAQ